MKKLTKHSFAHPFPIKYLRFALVASLLFFVSCVTDDVDGRVAPDTEAGSTTEQTDDYTSSPEFTSEYKSSPDAIYSLRNVQKAFDLVAGEHKTRAFTLEPTHHYVRFLPQDTTDIFILHDSLELEIFHFPFDHELTREELDMHLDTRINGYGWQYCLVEPDFPLPTEMDCELLDYVYLQPDDPDTITRSGGSYQLEPDLYYDIISKSMEITGKAKPETRLKPAWEPKGTVKYVSGITGDPSTIPVKGVHVRGNTDFNSGNAYTNGSGYFKINKGTGGVFRNKVHYMIFWEDKDGNWKIKDADGVACTKRDYDTWWLADWNPVYGDGIGERDDAEFGFCALINDAIYEYYHGTNSSTAGLVKYNKITVQEHWNEPYVSSYGDYRAGYFSIGSNNKIHIHSPMNNNGNRYDNTKLRSTVFHELGHASHYQTIRQTPGCATPADILAINYWNNRLENKFQEAWAMGFEYIYMKHTTPSYTPYYANEIDSPPGYPAIFESLINQDITISELQSLFANKTSLADCIPAVKALNRMPAWVVDAIFNNEVTPASKYNIDAYDISGPETIKNNDTAVYSILHNNFAALGIMSNGFTLSGGEYVKLTPFYDHSVAFQFKSTGLFTITASFTLPDGTTHTISKQVAVADTSMDKIPVGTNIRGWKFEIVATHQNYMYIDRYCTFEVKCGNSLNDRYPLIRAALPNNIRLNTAVKNGEPITSSPYAVDFGLFSSGWLVSDRFTFTVKDDMDYVVTRNDLPAGTLDAWGFDRVLVYRK